MERTSELKQMLCERKVVCREDILKRLETKSWMTAYRHLKKVEYIASFTHTCRYYTSKNIPEFDQHGIWFFGEIGFSKWGNLQQTIQHLILNSEAGKTHEEIQSLVRTQAYNALNKLVKSGLVDRKKIRGVYVYVSPETKLSKEQIVKRKKTGEAKRLSRTLIIEILAQTIRSTVGITSHKDVGKALRCRGIKVTNNEVSMVFQKFNLKKKTPD